MLTEFFLIQAELSATTRAFVIAKVRDQAGNRNDQANDRKCITVIPKQHHDKTGEHQYVAKLLRLS